MSTHAESAGIPKRWVKGIIDEVNGTVSLWPEFAEQANVDADIRDRIQKNLRDNLL